MALNPIGAAATIPIVTGVGQTSSAFDIRSNVIRLSAVGSDCHVKVASLDFTDNTAGIQPTTSDFYIPSGTTVTLQQKKASQRADSIDGGATTVVYAPQGTQWPFEVGDYVGLTTSSYNDSNWSTIIQYVKVTDVWNGNAGPYDSQKCKLTLAANTSGILTAYNPNGGNSIYRQNKVCTYGGSTSSAGALHYQQVQISGDA